MTFIYLKEFVFHVIEHCIWVGLCAVWIVQLHSQECFVPCVIADFNKKCKLCFFLREFTVYLCAATASYLALALFMPAVSWQSTVVPFCVCILGLFCIHSSEFRRTAIRFGWLALIIIWFLCPLARMQKFVLWGIVINGIVDVNVMDLLNDILLEVIWSEDFDLFRIFVMLFVSIFHKPHWQL